MPEIVTQTGIVNAAAQLLGSSERITNIQGDSRLARSALAAWDITMRTLLADHPWNFAITRAELNAGPAPAFGYDRSYALPADCLRVLPSRIEDGHEVYYDGEVEGGHILTNQEGPLRVRYISAAVISDCARWSAHLAKAAAYALATDMAEDITSSDRIDSKFTSKAEAALMRAKRVDGLETQRGNRSSPSARSRWLQGQRTPFNYYRD